MVRLSETWRKTGQIDDKRNGKFSRESILTRFFAIFWTLIHSLQKFQQLHRKLNVYTVTRVENLRKDACFDKNKIKADIAQGPSIYILINIISFFSLLFNSSLLL